MGAYYGSLVWEFNMGDVWGLVGSVEWGFSKEI